MAALWQPRALQVVQAQDAEPATVVLSSRLAQELALPRGGYALLHGKLGRSMVCVVNVNDGLDSGKIGLSGTELENLKVGLGSNVTLAPTGGLARARTVTVHPLAETVEGVTEDLLATYLQPYFQGIPPITVGSTFVLRRGRRPVEFAILDLMSSHGESMRHGIATIDTQVRCMEPLRRGDLQDPEDVSFHDVGGCQEAISRLRELVEVPLRHPELFKELGAPPPRAVLIRGQDGTGKSLLARAAARESEAGLVRLHGAGTLAAYLRSPKDGELELRDVFKQARQNAPCVILFEKLDIIAPDCGNTNVETKHLIVAHVLQLLREIRESVLVIATSSQDVGTSLRRCGGFDSEVFLNHPSQSGRREILEAKTRNLKLASDVRLGALATVTKGLSGAELELLCKKAAWACAMRTAAGQRARSNSIGIATAYVDQADFQQALSEIGVAASVQEDVMPDIMPVSQGGGQRKNPMMKTAAFLNTRSDPRQQQVAASVQEDTMPLDQGGGQRRVPKMGNMKTAGVFGVRTNTDVRQQPMHQQVVEEDLSASDSERGGAAIHPASERGGAPRKNPMKGHMKTAAFFNTRSDPRQQQAQLDDGSTSRPASIRMQAARQMMEDTGQDQFEDPRAAANVGTRSAGADTFDPGRQSPGRG